MKVWGCSGCRRRPQAPMPQDVKSRPDGHVFYVADMMSNGVWLVDGPPVPGPRVRAHRHRGPRRVRHPRLRVLSCPTAARGRSRARLRVPTGSIGKWHIPGGGSARTWVGCPPTGKVLWVSGRYDAVVYAISTVDGRLLARIPVGRGPHGLCVFPQPGRYSLGHTGVFR